VLSLLGLVFYQLLNSSLWKDVLTSLGKTVCRYESARIWIESESMKWLPGGVWSYGSRAILANRIGVKKREAATSMLWEVILTNFSWGVLAMTLFFSPPLMKVLMSWFAPLGKFSEMSVLIILLSVVVGCCLVYVYRNKLGIIATKVSGVKRANWSISLAVMLKYIVLNVGNLSLFYLICSAVPSVDITWGQAVAIGALSWLVGFWAIGVPGGIGVREAFMVFLLKEFMVLETAMAVAILWRLVQMLSEIIGVSLVMGSRSVKVFGRGGKNYEMG